MFFTDGNKDESDDYGVFENNLYHYLIKISIRPISGMTSVFQSVYGQLDETLWQSGTGWVGISGLSGLISGRTDGEFLQLFASCRDL